MQFTQQGGCVECEGGWLLAAPSGWLRKAAEREQEVVTPYFTHKHTTVRISVLSPGLSESSVISFSFERHKGRLKGLYPQ